METHKIDTLIKNALNDSENFYDSEALNAKERIWNQIHLQKQKKPLYIRLLAAASILLFIGLSVVTFSNIKYKTTINVLAESNAHLKNVLQSNSQKSLTRKEDIPASYKTVTDTIYVKQKVVEYKPLVTTTYITDTVYVKQIEYVEKEQNTNLTAVNENISLSSSPRKIGENNYLSEIILSNVEAGKKENGKKIQIKFGGNRAQTKNGILAFTAKL